MKKMNRKLCPALLASVFILFNYSAPAQAASSVDAKRALAYAQYGNAVTMALKSALASQKIYMTEGELASYRNCLVRTVQAMMPPGGMRALIASDSDYARKLQQMNDRVTRDCVPNLVHAVKTKYPR